MRGSVFSDEPTFPSRSPPRPLTSLPTRKVSMAEAPIPTVNNPLVLREIQLAHLKQLRDNKVGQHDVPPSASWDALTDLDERAAKHKQALWNGIQSLGIGKSNFNWDVLLGWLISCCAVGMRDNELMAKALNATSDVSALAYLKSAQGGIEAAAALLGMKFVQLCEDIRTVGTPGGWNGAFCGLFYPEDTTKNYVALVFQSSIFTKGGAESPALGKSPHTALKYFSAADWLPRTPTDQRLFGAHVHTGFFRDLFESFNGNSSSFGTVSWAPLFLFSGSISLTQRCACVPDVLRQQLNTAIGSAEPRVHLVGHSTGGALATLVWSEVLRLRHEAKVDEPWSTVIWKSLTTFGAPRVASIESANGVAPEKLHTGVHSWRIVNQQAEGQKQDDPVTTWAPLPGSESSSNTLPFIHIDSGKRISTLKAPEDVKSERPDKPEAPLHGHTLVGGWEEGSEELAERFLHLKGWGSIPHLILGDQPGHRSWANTPHSKER
ncbi:hypothetical protein P7C70_g8772, partial [Phenoliferia sp. Uapishka_3]